MHLVLRGNWGCALVAVHSPAEAGQPARDRYRQRGRFRAEHVRRQLAVHRVSRYPSGERGSRRVRLRNRHDGRREGRTLVLVALECELSRSSATRGVSSSVGSRCPAAWRSDSVIPSELGHQTTSERFAGMSGPAGASHSHIVVPNPSVIQPNLPRGVGLNVSRTSGISSVSAEQVTSVCAVLAGARDADILAVSLDVQYGAPRYKFSGRAGPEMTCWPCLRRDWMRFVVRLSTG